MPSLAPQRFRKRQGAAAVIAVNMRQQNLFDLFHAHRFRLLDNSVHVRVRAQRDIDNQDVLLTDDVLIRPLQSHDAGVVRGVLADEVRCSHSGPSQRRRKLEMNDG